MTILGFVVTEKSTEMAEDGKYTLWVDRSATKNAVAKTVSEVFGVEVINVKTINVKGKQKNWRRTKGKKPDRKKAIVTLKSGQKIKDFEVGQ